MAAPTKETEDGAVLSPDASVGPPRKKGFGVPSWLLKSTTIGLASLAATFIALIVSILTLVLPPNTEASEVAVHRQVYLDSAPFGSPNVGDRIVDVDDNEPMEIFAADVDKYAISLQVRIDNTGGSSVTVRDFAIRVLDGYAYAAKDANSYDVNQVDPMRCERSFRDRAPCSERLPEVLESRESLTLGMNLDQWFSRRAASPLGGQPLEYTLEVEGEGTEPQNGTIPVTFIQ